MSVASHPPIDALRKALADAATGGPLILDGAMGTRLEALGIPTPAPLWSAAALDTHPQVIASIHRDYVRAGARILVANTFRTNPRTLERAGRSADGPRLNRRALELAAAAASTAPAVWVAASIAPVEDCYRPDLVPDERSLRKEHARMIRWLMEAAAPLTWIETIGTIREAVAAAAAARDAGLPFVLSYILREDGRLLSGERLEDAIRELIPIEPLAVGVNCIPPAAICGALRRCAACTDLPLVAYGHLSDRQPLPGWTYGSAESPDAYAALARNWFRCGARIIGGCCGTAPEHIRALAKTLEKPAGS